MLKCMALCLRKYEKRGNIFQKKTNQNKQSMTASSDFCCPTKHEIHQSESKLQNDSLLICFVQGVIQKLR